MAHSRARLPAMCSGVGARSMTRIRVRSPSVIRRSPKLGSGYSRGGSEDMDFDDGFGSMKSNKVMVVVHSGGEAKGALELALSHTVQTHDSILLLYVANQSSSSTSEGGSQAYELLCSMKNLCQRKRPGVNVEVVIREGKNRGGVIVEEAKKQRVSLLVMGQRKRWVMWRLIQRLKSRRIHGGGGGGESDAVVKYCIQNSSCLTIAVRRQGKKLGGYLITTKRHKNFWLLA
ncbi:hypothetical protein LINPERPRIM_LOCUS23268 [Linum perenne]